MGFVSRSAFCECDVELGVRCLKVNWIAVSEEEGRYRIAALA
jgi:hypothetical protein